MMGRISGFHLYGYFPKKHLIPRSALDIPTNCNAMRFSSSVMESNRTYDLGNFQKDLKPFLKTRKRRKYSPFNRNNQNYGDAIIVCQNQRLNHHRNQTYEKFEEVPLASQNWRGHKSIGDSFTIDIYPKNFEMKYETSRKSFQEININPQILEVLKEKKIETMSEIQEKAIPIILSGKNSLVAAETGCGKTLAYVLPILEQVLKWKNAKKKECNAPFVIILTPSRELTTQIRDVVRWFKPLDLTCQRILGGHVRQKLGNPSVAPVDILVSTIGVLSKLIMLGLYSLKNVHHVVLDEADALLDDSFNQTTVGLLKRFRIRSFPSSIDNDGVQLTLVSATMPTSLPDIIGEIVDVDRIEKMCTSNLHKVMPNVSQKFLRITRSTKPAYLLQIIKKECRKKVPTIVFCNKTETCDWVSQFLKENNVNNLKLTGEMKLIQRKSTFEQFQNGEINILVSTSIAARGLDTKTVQHVINYEFPSFISDYIHRCGRTGRLGSNIHGKTTNLIAAKNEIELVQKIEKSVRTMSELENVNPNIPRILAFKNASELE